MTVAILVLIWAGAGYRVQMAARRPVRHRRLLAAAAVGMASATTLYLLREELDQALGVHNLALLLMRLVGVYAGMSGLLYLQDVRATDPAIPAIRTTAAIAAALLVVAWIFASLHDAQLTDIATLSAGWATVYGAVLYLYAGYVFLICARTASANARETRHADPAGALSTALIAAASAVALVVILLFLMNLVAGRPWLHTLRTALVPVPAVLMILGYVAIPLVAPAIRWIAATGTIRRTANLWSALVSTHPEVRLPMPPGARFSRALRAERRLIEIADSLEQHAVAEAADLPSLARAVIAPSAAVGESARRALVGLDHTQWPAPVLHLADAVTTLKEHRP